MGGGARGGRGDEAPPTNSAVECDAVGVAARRQSGEVAYRECGYRSSAVSLETRRWLLDFPSPFRFSTARGFRPRAFIRHGARFRSIRRFRSPVSPRFVVHEILADRLVIDAVTRYFFEQGIGRRESDGERWILESRRKG